MKVRNIIGAVAFLWAASVGANEGLQNNEPTMPEGVTSRMIAAGDISMEVWRAGDEGLAVVWVQDMHNYFTLQGEPQYSASFLEMAGPYREFLARLGTTYRSYAPMRRGYGKTEDDGAYDIPSHGRALIAMLDAEGIDKAVFLGRTPAQLDLLWLAENHPDRMAGVIFLEGTPQGMLDVNDPDMFAFGASFWRGAIDISTDVDKIEAITVGRLSSYVPTFLENPELQIEVPALYLESPPAFEGKWMWFEIFSAMRLQVQCAEVTPEFPCSVFGNPERVARLEMKLSEHPMKELAAQARERMQARFSNFQIDAFEPASGSSTPDAMWKSYYDRIQPFLVSISERQQ